MLKSFKILVVDDEDAIREVISEEFEMAGAKVDQANNGRKAFDMLKAANYDVVFSDVRMPNGDGVELINNIFQKLNPKPLVYLCTGFSDLSEAEAKKIGVKEVFSKPFNMDFIIGKIAADMKHK